MPIARVGAAQTSQNGAGSGSISVAKPASLANTHVVVLGLVINSASATWNVNFTGFTTVGPVTDATNGTTLVSYYKVITNAAGEPANYTFTFTSGSHKAGAASIAYSGVDNTAPVVGAFSFGLATPGGTVINIGGASGSIALGAKTGLSLVAFTGKSDAGSFSSGTNSPTEIFDITSSGGGSGSTKITLAGYEALSPTLSSGYTSEGPSSVSYEVNNSTTDGYLVSRMVLNAADGQDVAYGLRMGHTSRLSDRQSFPLKAAEISSSVPSIWSYNAATKSYIGMAKRTSTVNEYLYYYNIFESPDGIPSSKYTFGNAVQEYQASIYRYKAISPNLWAQIRNVNGLTGVGIYEIHGYESIGVTNKNIHNTAVDSVSKKLAAIEGEERYFLSHWYSGATSSFKTIKITKVPNSGTNPNQAYELSPEYYRQITEGATVSHPDGVVDLNWMELAPTTVTDKTVHFYKNVSDGNLYARVVDFNSTTFEPTFNTRYSTAAALHNTKNWAKVISDGNKGMVLCVEAANNLVAYPYEVNTTTNVVTFGTKTTLISAWTVTPWGEESLAVQVTNNYLALMDRSGSDSVVKYYDYDSTAQTLTFDTSETLTGWGGWGAGQNGIGRKTVGGTQLVAWGQSGGSQYITVLSPSIPAPDLSSTKSAYIGGYASATDNQPIFVAGSVAITSSSTCYIRGSDGELDSHSAFVHGHSSITSSHTNYINGTAPTISSSIGCFIDCALNTFDSTDAYIAGIDSQSVTQPIYMFGAYIGTVSVSCYINSAYSATLSQSAFIGGGDTVSSSKNLYINGVGVSTGTQAAFVSGPILSIIYPTRVINDAPVAYWKFDETSGTTVNDSIGSRHGTTSGTTSANAAPLVDNMSVASRQFSGGFVTVPNHSSLQITGSMTLEFWVRLTNVGTGRHNIVGKAYSGEIALTLETNGLLNYFHGQAGANTESQYLGFAILPAGGMVNNVTYHIIIVRDHTAKTVRTWKNGVEVTNFSYAGNFNPSASGLNLLLMNGYTNDPPQGRMDDVSLYNYALSDAQVAAHNDLSYPLTQTSSPQLAFLHATRVQTGSQPLHLVGPIAGTAIDSQSTFINGWQAVTQMQSVYLQGGASLISSKSAFIVGNDNFASHMAYIVGPKNLSSSQSAFIFSNTPMYAPNKLCYINGALGETGSTVSAIRFNKALSQRLEYPHTQAYEVSHLTINFWYKPTETPSTSRPAILTKHHNIYGRSWGFFTGVGTNVIHYGVAAGGVWNGGDSSTTLTIGNWYMVTMTYDRFMCRLYLNGVLNAEFAKTGNIDYDTTGPLDIAYRRETGLYGSFDFADLTILPYSLLGPEVAALYTHNMTTYKAAYIVNVTDTVPISSSQWSYVQSTIGPTAPNIITSSLGCVIPHASQQDGHDCYLVGGEVVVIEHDLQIDIDDFEEPIFDLIIRVGTLGENSRRFQDGDIEYPITREAYRELPGAFFQDMPGTLYNNNLCFINSGFFIDTHTGDISNPNEPTVGPNIQWVHIMSNLFLPANMFAFISGPRLTIETSKNCYINGTPDIKLDAFIEGTLLHEEDINIHCYIAAPIAADEISVDSYMAGWDLIESSQAVMIESQMWATVSMFAYVVSADFTVYDSYARGIDQKAYIFGGVSIERSHMAYIEGINVAQDSQACFLMAERADTVSMGAFINSPYQMFADIQRVLIHGRQIGAGSQSVFLMATRNIEDVQTAFIKAWAPHEGSHRAYIVVTPLVLNISDNTLAYIKAATPTAGNTKCFIVSGSLESTTRAFIMSVGNINGVNFAYLHGTAGTSTQSCYLTS